MSDDPPQTVHASCVAIDGRGVLIAGPSGAGKSDLALRLIDAGAVLVSDDYTVLTALDGRLHAAPPATIAGRIEVRGIGIVECPFVRDVPVALWVEAGTPERMPEAMTHVIAGIALPAYTLALLEPSAPARLHLMLDRIAR
ncbi:MAG: HPr kinase/phosphatase C-terminal domain-containing protein [Sphingomonas paucimobilis]